MTKNEIKQLSSIGISEDINGDFYTIYDYDKIHSLIVNKAETFIRSRLPRVMNYYNNNEDIRDEFEKYMNE